MIGQYGRESGESLRRMDRESIHKKLEALGRGGNNQDNVNSAGKGRVRLLDVDGPVFTVLTKTGELILLSFVWLVCSLPVITLGASTTALYYAVVKNIRRGRGYPIREFFKMFKLSFVRATCVTLIGLLWGAAMYRLITIALSLQSAQGSFLMRIYAVLVIVTVAVLIYVFPVISRFEISVGKSIGLAFVMAGRCVGYTACLLAMGGIMVYLFIYIPFPLIILFPSLWTLVSSFLIERALKKYMPEPSEASDESGDQWFYE